MFKYVNSQIIHKLFLFVEQKRKKRLHDKEKYAT